MVTLQEINELKDQMAVSCRILGSQGVTKGSYGHVSARIPGTDRVLIKGKGPDQEALEFATARDMVTVDIEGALVEAPPGLMAPDEAAMHLAVYRHRPDVMSVIHTHPDWVVLLTAVGKPILPIYGAYEPQGMRLAVDGVPVYPRTLTITDEKLGDEFMAVMGDKNACLLRGHGMTTAGRSVEDCTQRSLLVFELARMNYMAYAIGTPEPIPDEDLEAYRRRDASGARTRFTGPSSSGESFFWRYQKQLLTESPRPGKDRRGRS